MFGRRLAAAAPVRGLARRNGAMWYSNNSDAARRFSTSTRKTPSFLFDAKVAGKSKRVSLAQSNDGADCQPDTCGEDSYFVSPTIVGVADGVGGWNDQGVSPAAMSRSLMRNASNLAQSMEPTTTLEVLKYGYNQALDDDEVEAGSTTACILRLKESEDGKPVLEYSNLGDSGFVLFRDDKVVFRSEFQAYGLAPYQLAKIPDRYRRHGAIENSPDDADTGEIEVQEGDVIVLATDGVFDNFAPDLGPSPAFFPPMRVWQRHWHQALRGLLDVMKASDNPAASIVRASVEHNLKPDDITVVVAKIVGMKAKL